MAFASCKECVCQVGFEAALQWKWCIQTVGFAMCHVQGLPLPGTVQHDAAVEKLSLGGWGLPCACCRHLLLQGGHLPGRFCHLLELAFLYVCTFVICLSAGACLQSKVATCQSRGVHWQRNVTCTIYKGFTCQAGFATCQKYIGRSSNIVHPLLCQGHMCFEK